MGHPQGDRRGCESTVEEIEGWGQINVGLWYGASDEVGKECGEQVCADTHEEGRLGGMEGETWQGSWDVSPLSGGSF